MHHPPHWGRPPHAWRHGTYTKRRFLFRRFILILGGFSSLFLCMVAITVGLVLGSSESTAPRWELILAGVCGIPLAFMLITGFAGSMAFRRFGLPIAEVMSAADAVAGGDLSVRLNEDAPGEFRRLAHSFNHMTSELERAAKHRRNMTADVAHELRTPLHIIQGNLEGVLDGVYEPTPKHISTTLDEVRLMSRLVDDLQTLSLAETGQLPMHFQRLSAADLVSDVATSFGGQAEAAGIELRLEIQGEAGELELEGDPGRLDQVLSNLVSNALRHTPGGGQIVLEAQPITGGVRLRVRDNGVGIPEEDLPFIFDRFWRGDASRSRQTGGSSGLGLAIARQLVLLHGGQIGVESQPGQGTTFSIELPRER